MVKYVIKNILNTIQYMIKRYIKKVYLLIIMFLLGMIFQSNVFAAEEEWTSTTPINAGAITVDTNNFNFVSFGGFQCYYIPVKKSMKVGFYVDATKQFEYRCGFSRNIPSVGNSATSISYGTVSSPKFSDYVSYQATYDGYFYFSFYPSDAVSLALYTQISSTDAIAGLDSTIQQQTNIISQQTQIIQNQTTAINNQTNTLNNSINNSTNTINNSITSTDFDDNDINIDGSSADVDDTQVNNLFTTLFINFQNKITGSNWSSVETLSIPFPYSQKTLDIHSDLISSHLQGTFLYTLIQCAWFSAFGIYVFKFSNNIIKSIRSGDILSGLSLDDEVISSTML